MFLIHELNSAEEEVIHGQRGGGWDSRSCSKAFPLESFVTPIAPPHLALANVRLSRKSCPLGLKVPVAKAVSRAQWQEIIYNLLTVYAVWSRVECLWKRPLFIQQSFLITCHECSRGMWASGDLTNAAVYAKLSYTYHYLVGHLMI